MFFTKRELLMFLGKNENDNKLVDRMIKRWEVIRLADGYELVEDDVGGLKWKIKELEWKIEDLERREKELSSNSSNSSNDTDLANDLANRLSNDLEYLNIEYEKLEGLLDYSLRKCYDMMKKKGLVGSEDTYDDFYTRITEGYSARGVSNTKSVAHTTKTNVAHATGSDLNSVIQKFGISKASDFIS